MQERNLPPTEDDVKKDPYAVVLTRLLTVDTKDMCVKLIRPETTVAEILEWVHEQTWGKAATLRVELVKVER